MKDNQIVLVMDELDAINFHKKGYDEDCAVIPYNSECLPKKDPLIQQLQKANLLKSGEVLIRSPFGPEYYPLENATMEAHHAYFKKYSLVCGFLGATHVKVKKCEINSETTKTGGKADVSVPDNLGGNVSVKIGKDSNTEFLSKLEDKFEKNIDLAKAEELMTEFGLEGDSDLNELVAALKKGVKLTSRDVTLRLSQSLKSTFDLAAKITPYAGINIKGMFDHKKEMNRVYTLVLSLQF